MASNIIDEIIHRIGGDLWDGVAVCGIYCGNGRMRASIDYFENVNATYTRDGIYMWNNFISEREWQSYGHLWTNVGFGSGGVSCLGGTGMLDHDHYLIATSSDATWMLSNAVASRVWFSYADLLIGTARGGINIFHSSFYDNSTLWSIATILPTLVMEFGCGVIGTI